MAKKKVYVTVSRDFISRIRRAAHGGPAYVAKPPKDVRRTKTLDELLREGMARISAGTPGRKRPAKPPKARR